MIPLRDKNPTHIFPFVNLTLIGLNLGVFAYQISLGAAVETLYQHYGLIPAHLVGLINAPSLDPRILATVLSSLFLHGGWLHMGGNMLFLWVFGDNIEDKLGHYRYAFFYFACGIAASLAHVIVNPHSMVPTIGASGAISGVLGAYLLLFPKARIVTLIPIFFFIQLAELPALVVLGLWFIIQFLYGMASLGDETAAATGVAWWAHVGGFLAGSVLIFPLRKFK